jgi:hemolysin D
MFSLRLQSRASADAAAAVLLEFQSPSAALLAAAPPASARSTVWIVGALVVSLTTAAGLIPIDRVVAARGRVVMQAPTLVVQPLETAIVRSIDVRVGQVVRAGELLARLDPTFAVADAATLETQVASSEAEVARLEAEADDRAYQPVDTGPAATLQASIFAQRRAERDFRLDSYRQRMVGLEVTIARSHGEAQLLRQRLSVASQVEAMRRELERLQVGSRLNALAAIDARVEITRALAVAERTAQASQQELWGLGAERDAYLQQWRGTVSQDLVDRRRTLGEARELLNKARLRRDLVELRAPADGVVLTLARVSVGSVLQSADQFITLVPRDAPIEIEADIEGLDSGFVRVGNPAVIKFDAFPFMKYGTAEGQVRVISADAFLLDEAQRPTGPFYRGRITVDAFHFEGVPADFQPVPGMPVVADIKVGERTILSYFLERLMRPASEGMREP